MKTKSKHSPVAASLRQAQAKPSNRQYLRCASQHFGPWMIEPEWFRSAVQAVRDGTFKMEEGERDEYALPDPGADGIAVIPIQGHLTKGESSYGGTSYVRTRDTLRKAADDAAVKSIALFIDSPGGTVAGAFDLADDIAKADKKKPVYAIIQDLGASAGYLLASQARRIWANPTALIGSVGVVSILVDSSGAAERAGIKVHVVSTGPFKGAGADGAPLTEAQLADAQTQVNDINEHFIAALVRGRGMTDAQARAVADGRVHIAEKAKQIGLIDEIASLDAIFQAINSGSGATAPRMEANAMATNQEVQAACAEVVAAQEAYSAACDACSAACADMKEMPDEKTSTACTECSAAIDAAAASGTATKEACGRLAGMAQPAETPAEPPAETPEQKAAAARASLAALLEAAGGDHAMATAAFLAGQTPAAVALAAKAAAEEKAKAKAVADAHAKELAAKDAEIARLQYAAGGQKPIGTNAAAKEAEQKAAEGDGGKYASISDPEARAKAEWAANLDGCCEAFVSEAVYVDLRKLEMAGRVKAVKVGK